MNALRALRWMFAVLILVGLIWQGSRFDSAPLQALEFPAGWPLACAFALGIAGCFLLFLAWAGLRPGPSPWSELAPVWFGSLLARYAPGGVWQGVARVAAAGAAGESKRDALERFAAELTLACCSAAVVALAAGAVGTPPVDRGTAMLLAAIAVAATCSAVVGPRAGFAIGWTLRAWWRMLLAHVVIAFGFALLVQAWFAAPPAAIPATMSTFLVAGIAGVLAVFVPAGLGVREAVLAGMLAPRIGVAPAIALALAARVWLVACEVAAWALATWLWRRPARTDLRG